MDKKKTFQVVISVIAVLTCGVIYLTVNGSREPGEVVTEHFADEEGALAEQPASPSEDGTAYDTAPASETQDSESIYVHMCGEVKNPGVYIFETPPRLAEAVERAGGFTKKADQSAVNLAEPVSDGSQITIPKKRQGKSQDGDTGSSTEDKDPAEASGGKVNINTASREELMTLNGIGESKASQIIAYRETHGSFKKIDDIMNISGIKEGVFSKIRDFIII